MAPFLFHFDTLIKNTRKFTEVRGQGAETDASEMHKDRKGQHVPMAKRRKPRNFISLVYAHFRSPFRGKQKISIDGG